MSLINQVLKDLDARQQENGELTQLPNDVRPLPASRKSRRPFILGALLLIALVLGVALSPWDSWLQEAAPRLPPVSSTAAVPVLPVAAPAVPTVTPATAPVVVPEKAIQPPEELSVQKNAEASPEQNFDRSLRMSDAIALPDGKRIEKKSVARPAAGGGAPVISDSPVVAGKKIPAERGKKELPSEARAEAVERSLPNSPARNVGKRDSAPMIERTDAVGSPREQAENEYRKAISAINLGRMTEALEGLRTALRQDGLHVASRQLLVKLLLESKQGDEAIRVLHDGLRELPAQIGWAMSLARLQMDRGDLSGAWQTLDQSLPAAGNNADYQGFAAHVLQRLGRSRDAAEHYSIAARLSPGDGRWWLGLGLAQESEGHSTEAREAFLRARQSGNLSPDLAAMVEQKLH